MAVVAQFVGPGRTNPVADPALDITRQPGMPSAVKTVLARSCRDCHSNETIWPWYAHVAPASWLVVSDVNEARSVMNFSRWAADDEDDQDNHLRKMCRMLQAGV